MKAVESPVAKGLIDRVGSGAYTRSMSDAIQLAEIPPDLAAEAAQVPGLPQRLLRFLRAEVSQHRKRQSRYSEEAQRVAQAATELADELRSSGMSPAEARTQFVKLYAEVLKEVSGKP